MRLIQNDCLLFREYVANSIFRFVFSHSLLLPLPHWLGLGFFSLFPQSVQCTSYKICHMTNDRTPPNTSASSAPATASPPDPPHRCIQSVAHELRRNVLSVIHLPAPCHQVVAPGPRSRDGDGDGGRGRLEWLARHRAFLPCMAACPPPKHHLWASNATGAQPFATSKPVVHGFPPTAPRPSPPTQTVFYINSEKKNTKFVERDEGDALLIGMYYLIHRSAGEEAPGGGGGSEGPPGPSEGAGAPSHPTTRSLFITHETEVTTRGVDQCRTPPRKVDRLLMIELRTG